MKEGIPARISTINRAKPCVRTPFQSCLIMTSQIASVKKTFIPPIMKKSTMSPSINPIMAPVVTRTARIRIHAIPSTVNNAENAIPCRKYRASKDFRE